MAKPDSEISKMVVGQYLGVAGMGGAEVYAALIANMHAQNGELSHVIVRSGPGPISTRFGEDVHVHYMNYTRGSIRKPIAFIRSLFRGYRLLSNQIEANEIEVLHTHLPAENLWGLVMALAKKCKVVITIHNNNFLSGSDGTKVGKAITRIAYKMMLKYCHAIVVVSDEVGQSYREFLNVSDSKAAKITVVNNGVLIPKRLSKSEKQEIRSKNGVSSSDFWIVAAGRLTEAKNFSCLVKAVGELKSKDTNVKVTIGGEGHLRSKLEQEIRERGIHAQVALPGNLDNLSEIMQSADLLAMPSLWEGLPLTLLEAMARELPVVGTMINGLSDIVTNGKQGFLVPVDNSPALAAAIEKMILQPELRSAMGSEGRKLVEERYSFTRVYSQLIDVYSQAMGTS